MKRIKLIAVILTAVVLAGAVTAWAALGGESDPLVTLSYLTDVFAPKVDEQVDAAVAENRQTLVDDLEQVAQTYKAELEGLTESGGAASETPSPVYTRKTLSAGEQWTGTEGNEVLFRSGTAAAVGSLVDATTGEVLFNGAPLTVNHLYVVLTDGAGLTVSVDAVILVR